MTQIIQPLITKTAAFVGSAVLIDNTVFQQNALWSLRLRVQSLSPGAAASFTFQYSNVYNFSSYIAGPEFSVVGSISVDWTDSVTQKDWPVIQIGMPNAALRLALSSLTGTNPSVTYTAWLVGSS